VSERKYDESNIDVQEGLEGVRHSPGMYIGGTDNEARKHMVREIVHNSVDEFSAGRANKITVTLNDDNQTITVEDNGSGIPTGINEKSKKNTVETVLTMLHAGGKFDSKKGGYSRSGGMHGVGGAVVNALSTSMIAVIHRDGKIHKQSFSKGIPQTGLEVIGKTDRTGTSITFTPDLTIMQDIPYDAEQIVSELEELAYLNKGLTLEFIYNGEKRVFESKNGIASLVEKYCKSEKVLNNPITITGKSDKYDMLIDVAFNYIASSEEVVVAYTNNVRNPEGGKHVDGFKSALTRVINRLAGQKYTGAEIRNGLVAAISVKMAERPVLVGQTKGKLGSENASPAVDSLVYAYLLENLSANSKLVKFIIKRAEASKKSTDSMNLMKDIEDEAKQDFAYLKTKLQPAIGKGKKKELYIVEGDSAAGTVIQGRELIKDGIQFQAILPIRGKILNVDRATIDKILANLEVRNLVTTFGVGFGNDKVIPEDGDYEKICILADADPDGAHIQTLLLTFLYSYMRPLLYAGRVYVALPPLYKVYTDPLKKYIFCTSEEEKDAAIVKLGPKAEVQRYKGLGEMDAWEIAETVLNPESRTLIQIVIDDEAETQAMMTDLMGKDTAARKEIMVEAGVWAE
jgi:DNA gyrase subunit B